MDIYKRINSKVSNDLTKLSSFMELIKPFTNPLNKKMEEVSWIPIYVFPETNECFGIAETNTWVLTSEEGLKPIDNQDRYIAVIKFLEIDYDDLIFKLIEFENSTLNDSVLVSVFPFVEIIRGGVLHTGEYWTNLAIEWYEKIEPKKQTMLLNDFTKITNSPRLSQKTKHKIKKILKHLNFGKKDLFR